MIFDFIKGIHPDSCTSFEVHQDIIVTPFYTKDYCYDLVTFFEENANRFRASNDVKYVNYSIWMNEASMYFVQDYVDFVKDRVRPLVNNVYSVSEWETPIFGASAPFINRYRIGEQTAMDLHTDVSNITILIPLTDDHEGGEVVFPRQNFSTEGLDAGTALIFPGTITHPHYVTEVTKGTRYSQVGFTPPPSWKSDGIIFY